MNDSDRAALVEELTKAQHDAWPGLDADFIVNTEAIMPIIDRLLAAAAVPGLDELLDSVHPDACIRHMYVDGDKCEVDIGIPKYRDDGGPHTYQVFRGTGPTRTAAIQAAVANAKKGAGNE